MISCKVSTAPLQCTDPAAEISQRLSPDAIVIAELADQVRVLRLRDFTPTEALLRLHAFDGRAACLLERWTDRFVGRWVAETEDGQECQCIERRTLLFGEVHPDDGGVLLKEQRIQPYRLPIAAPPGAHVYLYYRQYITYDEDGAARVFASRAVEFRSHPEGDA